MNDNQRIDADQDAQDSSATLSESDASENNEDNIKMHSSTSESPRRFLNIDREASYGQIPSSKKSGKPMFLLIGLLLVVVVVVAGILLRPNIKGVVDRINPTPVPTAEPTPEPTPTPNPLIRSDWSFEVLNGSGETGLAKKFASQIQDLGYPVVKTGNADKSNYTQTQILAKKELLDKVDLVIADLKDVIKIASVAGELQEGTASARIIIGKDSI